MPNSALRSTQLAQALALEQVAFYKEKLLKLDPNSAHPDQPYFIQPLVQQLYQNAKHLLLKDVIQPEQLHAVIQRYCFELNLGVEILEFIGIAAREVHLQLEVNDTPLKHLLADASFDVWMRKVLELDQLRDDLHDFLLQSEHVQQISLQLANHIVTHNTPWLDTFRKLQLKQQGLAAKGLGFLQDQQLNIELKLEQHLAQTLRKQLADLMILPSDELADFATLLWATLRDKSVKQYCSHIEAIDVEEFFILLYESWKQLRQTEFMQSLILNVADAFYQHFAEYDLQSLFDAVGLDQNDLLAEAVRFLPPFFSTLDELNLLDPILCNLIEPFYQQPHIQDLIESHLK